MGRRFFYKTTCTLMGLLLALPLRPAIAADSVPLPTADVALSATGTLSGQVVSAEGISLGNVNVVLHQGDHEVAQARTAADGGFKITGLQGGTYTIKSEGGAVVCRAWVAQTAPPVAQPGVLVVSASAVQRGACCDRRRAIIVGGTIVGVAGGLWLLDQNDDDAASGGGMD